MKPAARRLARFLLPDGARRWWRRTFGWRWFRGDYASWAEARADARGYDDEAGFRRVTEAARAVRAGRAAWDRDGLVFDRPAVHAPLLQALRAVAADRGGRLAVVDFGGGLGSTWWQHRGELRDCDVRWRVVEQAALAAAGRREFGDAVLSFHDTLDEAWAAGTVDAVLLSSVLPYVEQPHAILADVLGRGVPHVILDRTPFIGGGRDRLAVQCTPPQLGGGSYPCWLFDRARLLAHFTPDHELAAEWTVAFDAVDGTADYRGLHFRRRAGAATRP